MAAFSEDVLSRILRELDVATLARAGLAFAAWRAQVCPWQQQRRARLRRARWADRASVSGAEHQRGAAVRHRHEYRRGAHAGVLLHCTTRAPPAVHDARVHVGVTMAVPVCAYVRVRVCHKEL